MREPDGDVRLAAPEVSPQLGRFEQAPSSRRAKNVISTMAQDQFMDWIINADGASV